MQIRDHLLPFYNERPAGTVVDTLIVHSMFNPQFADPTSFDACMSALNTHRVSAHFVIDQAGSIYRLVPEVSRAWHAGVSQMPDGRENVNDFSLGVELIASPEMPYKEVQYASLAWLTAELKQTFPLQFILGHEHIAPGRKIDPGSLFSWQLLREMVQKEQLLPPPLQILPALKPL